MITLEMPGQLSGWSVPLVTSLPENTLGPRRWLLDLAAVSSRMI